jgi:hypothetical protein
VNIKLVIGIVLFFVVMAVGAIDYERRNARSGPQIAKPVDHAYDRTYQARQEKEVEQRAADLRAKSEMHSFMMTKKIDEVGAYDQWIACIMPSFGEVVLELPHGTSASPGSQGHWQVINRGSQPFTKHMVNKVTGAQWDEQVFCDVYRVVE